MINFSRFLLPISSDRFDVYLTLYIRSIQRRFARNTPNGKNKNRKKKNAQLFVFAAVMSRYFTVLVSSILYDPRTLRQLVMRTQSDRYIIDNGIYIMAITASILARINCIVKFLHKYLFKTHASRKIKRIADVIALYLL